MVMHMPFMKKSIQAPTGVHHAIAQGEEWLNTHQPLSADDVAGRILLLDFWTFCCINCMHVIPELKILEETFGDDLTVIGVHSGKFQTERATDNIREAVLRYDIEHAVVNDPDFKIWKSFGVHAWPTLIVITPEGAIDKVYTGEGHLEELRRDISRLRERFGSELNRAPLPIALEREKTPTSPLSFPGKLAWDFDREILFVSDSNHQRILGLSLTGEVRIVIGGGKVGWKDGSFDEAQFNQPQGLFARDGMVYVADTRNHLLRKIDLERKMVSTLAGTGKQGQDRFVSGAPALKTALASPWDIATGETNDELVVAMAGTHQLWSYSLSKKTLSVVAGSGLESIDDGVYPLNSLSQPSGLSRVGKKLYFVDSETSALRVLEDGNITTLLGTGLFDFGFTDGTSDRARMQHPIGLFVEGRDVYIADTYNHAIRHFDVKTGMLSTLVRDLNEPNDVVKIGNVLYIADTNNHRLVMFDLVTKKMEPLPVWFPVRLSCGGAGAVCS